ncbi:hypothetical protein CAC42_4555 [Sphaceloma murrayae]|uniref:Thioredoxin domain-containing protein n=1 Tax=Sphaceloma murrayae TaxID=2082308 RepID=A0A2K1QLW8_9PEZI|nr:hypothetical protein CAC42_4555 [Sphaceloma murrayae]
MANIDARVASLVDKRRDADSDDEDALIAALEDEDSNSLSGFREQRLQQLHSEFTRAKAQRESGFGTYQEIKEEKDVLDLTTSTKLAVIHFMKPDFTRCRIMDQKLEALAPKHFDTRFASINVENAPFLVAKLKIQVLPCVIAFVNAVAVDRLIGFEGIGYKPDSFTLQELEARLLRTGVLVRSKMTQEDERRRLASRTAEQEDEDDDWD